ITEMRRELAHALAPQSRRTALIRGSIAAVCVLSPLVMSVIFLATRARSQTAEPSPINVESTVASTAPAISPPPPASGILPPPSTATPAATDSASPPIDLSHEKEPAVQTPPPKTPPRVISPPRGTPKPPPVKKGGGGFTDTL